MKIIIPKQQNYEVAQKLAWEALDSADFTQIAKKAGAKWDGKKKTITVNLLGKNLEVHPLDKSVGAPLFNRRGDAAPSDEPWEIIIVLHYLAKSNGAPLTGRLISYKEIPDGRLYWPNFVARTHKILLKAFAKNISKLAEAAKVVDGEPSEGADVSIRVQALPRVPIIIQMWKGDEEFPPETAFLFDSSITNYLPTEDITVLSQMLAIKLATAAKDRP